jgi:hypothetical protein
MRMSEAINQPPSGLGQHIWVAGLLGNLHDAGIAVATCSSGLYQDRFFATCLTRKTGLRSLEIMQRTASILRMLPSIGRGVVGNLNGSLSFLQTARWSSFPSKFPVQTGR